MRRGCKYRVLIVVQDLPVPYDRRTWLTARTLSEAGYKVSVICPKGEGFVASRERIDEIDIYRYWLPVDARGMLGYFVEFSWCFTMTSLLSLWVQLLGRGFDVIHACNPPETYWLLGMFWRPFGKRLLFDHHDLSPEMYEAKFNKKGGFAHRALLWLERRTFQTAHTTIATNTSYREVALQRGGISEDQVFIVRSGPDGERFKIVEAEPELKRGHRYLCLYLGRMCEQDGVDYLLRAAHELVTHRGRRDIQFVLVGEGPAEDSLQAQILELDLGDHCMMTGFLPSDQVSRYLSTADVGIDPSPKNPWSDRSTMNKVLDYMFVGCPIVAFDLTENMHSAGDAGLFVRSNSEACIADAIETLLADEPLRRKMGANGKRRVRESLMWEHSTEGLLAAYNHVFEGYGQGAEKGGGSRDVHA